MDLNLIVRLYKDEYNVLEQDISYAKRYIRDKNILGAANQYKHIGRKFEKLHRFDVAASFYLEASEQYKQSEHYQKMIGIALRAFSLYEISYKLKEMASIHEKIAGYYLSYFEDYSKSGFYYLSAAQIYERDQNYLSAFKKAKYAVDLYEKGKDQRLWNAVNFAFRMALQSNYYERAGIYARKMLEITPKDYSNHYISVCMKGYKSIMRTEKPNEALFFVNELIIAHFEKNNLQRNILEYLYDAQLLHIKVHHCLNEDYNKKILSLLDMGNKIKYSARFKTVGASFDLDKVSDFFYIQENTLRGQNYYRNRSYWKFILYWMWGRSCSYGTSISKWFSMSAVFILMFGIIFWCATLFNIPVVDSTNIPMNWFSHLYFSVITFTTLGYGDIAPVNMCGQILCTIEVVVGYLMLGGLLSVFSKKIIK